MTIRTLPESWSPREGFRDSADDQWAYRTFTSGASESKTAKENEGHVEDCKVGAEDWLAHKFELSKDFILRTTRFTGQHLFMPHQPTKVTSMTKCPNQVHQSQHNLRRIDQINHDLWDPSENHNWRWLLWNQRMPHQRQIDTTDTTDQHHDAHQICSKQLVSLI